MAKSGNVRNVEVELEGDVFASQRTAADSVRFVFALLITSTKRELVDEVHGGRALPVCGDFRPQLVGVVLSDSVDVTLLNNVNDVQYK